MGVIIKSRRDREKNKCLKSKIGEKKEKRNASKVLRFGNKISQRQIKTAWWMVLKHNLEQLFEKSNFVEICKEKHLWNLKVFSKIETEYGKHGGGEKGSVIDTCWSVIRFSIPKRYLKIILITM